MPHCFSLVWMLGDETEKKLKMLQGSRMNKELGQVTQRFVCTIYCSNLCKFDTPSTPGCVVLFFFFFFTTLHAKNRSALEFIFGEMVLQLIRRKEWSSFCLVLETQVPGALPATETKRSSVKPELELRVFIQEWNGLLAACSRIFCHTSSICVCAGLNRSIK